MARRLDDPGGRSRATALLTAVEPLDDVSPSSGKPGHWAQMAETLRAADLPSDATVSIRRY